MTTDQAPRGFFRRLGPGLTAFLAVDVLLVAVFVALLVGALQERGEAADPAPTAAQEPEVEVSPDETPAADTEDVGALTAFVLPSGNIHCAMTETSASCTILQFQFEVPAAPEGCAGTVGNTLSIEAGAEARFACLEDGPPPAPEGAAVLDYGEQSTVGEMTCTSSRNGVLCQHVPSGEGFSLARAGYILF